MIEIGSDGNRRFNLSVAMYEEFDWRGLSCFGSFGGFIGRMVEEDRGGEGLGRGKVRRVVMER